MTSVEIYDHFIGGQTGTIDYITQETVIYPDSNMTTILGQVWLPRIYGKDLTALEIASSGKIAITLTDIHSFDLQNVIEVDGEDNSNLKTVLNTLSNYSFELAANDGELRVTLDSANNDAIIYAPSNVLIEAASNDVNVVAGSNITLSSSNIIMNGDVTFNGEVAFDSGDFNINASNIYLNASSNVVIQGDNNITMATSNESVAIIMDGESNNLTIKSDSNIAIESDTFALSASNATVATEEALAVTSGTDTTFVVGNDFAATVGNDMTLVTETGTLKLATESDSVYLTLDTDTSNMVGYAASDATFTAGSNMTLITEEGALKLATASDSVYLTLDVGTSNMTGYADNDAIFTVGNDFAATVGNDMTLVTETGTFKVATASDSVYLTLDTTTSNMVGYAASETTFTAGSNMTFVTEDGALKLATASDSVYLTLDVGTSNMTGYADNDATFTVGNDFAATVGNDMTLVTETGTFKAATASDSVYLTLDTTTSNMVGHAKNDILFSSSNDVSVTASSNITLGAEGIAATTTMAISLTAGTNLLATTDSNMTLVSGNDATLTASNDIVIAADSNLTLTGLVAASLTTEAGGAVNLLAGDNVYLTLDYDAATLIGGAASNIEFYSGKDLVVVTSNNVNITATSGDLGIYSSSIFMTMSNNDINFSTPQKVVFNAGTNDTFSISSNSVTIKGNLLIDGEVTSCNTTLETTSLLVADKVIQLANSGSNELADGAPFDGIANDGAGIVIDGVPETAAEVDWPLHEKSIKWNYGDEGTFALGTSNLAAESYWEFLGGSMRMTQKKEYDDARGVKDVAFGFRINEIEELELVKKYFAPGGTDYTYKRVAKFGRVLAA